jgi:hypothetical protein
VLPFRHAQPPRLRPPAGSDRPQWLIIATMQHPLVEITPSRQDADLADTMRVEVSSLAEDGWRAEGYGRYGFLFVAGGAARHPCSMTPDNPEEVSREGHAYLAGHAYKAGHAYGLLLRTVNHNERTHTLQRQIRRAGVGSRRGQRTEELIAQSGALSLVTNMVMA